MISNEKPKVSIAIVTYNQKLFLRDCIESCLSQSYSNFEIVVADDGSTDGTQEMLGIYKKKFPDKFVLVLSKKNQGITKNSNCADRACTGKYVAWMGGDDIFLPEKISIQVDYMERNPDCVISYHDMDVFDSDSNKTLYFGSQKNRPREGGIDVCIKYGAFNGACTTMVRASSRPKNGFNENLPVASDWCYWIDALSSGGSINYISKVLSRYRRHENNITNKSKLITQANLDILNTCNYIICKYPEYLNEALFRYSINIRSLRDRSPYIGALMFSIRTNFDIKSIFALLVNLATLGKLKL
jgi:glycosyltransferase involved in cell wall biosynthesis